MKLGFSRTVGALSLLSSIAIATTPNISWAGPRGGGGGFSAPSAPSRPEPSRPSAPSFPSAPSRPEPSRPSAPSFPSRPTAPSFPSNGGGFGGGHVSQPSRPTTPNFPSRPTAPSFPSNGGGFGGGHVSQPSRPTMPTAPSRPTAPNFPPTSNSGGGNHGGFGGGGINPNRPNHPNQPAQPNRPSQPTPPSQVGQQPNRPTEPNRPGQQPGQIGQQPNRPAQPTQPSQPVRPNGSQKAPNRNVVEGRGNGPDVSARKQQIDQRRNEVQNDRRQNRPQIIRIENTLRVDREQFHERISFQPRYTEVYIRNNSIWADRYSDWYVNCAPVSPFYYDISWYEPMPTYAVWTYDQVSTVSVNLEFLARTIYQNASAATNNPTVLNALAQLADAAEDYTDTVYAGTDYTDTLNNLFYLDSTLSQAEQVLRVTGSTAVVSNDMIALRAYVNQLLWSYRQAY